MRRGWGETRWNHLGGDSGVWDVSRSPWDYGLCSVLQMWVGGDAGYPEDLPMRKTEASQTVQLPRVAGRPFLSTTSSGFLTSRDARHLRQ